MLLTAYALQVFFFAVELDLVTFLIYILFPDLISSFRCFAFKKKLNDRTKIVVPNVVGVG